QLALLYVVLTLSAVFRFVYNRSPPVVTRKLLHSDVVPFCLITALLRTQGS
ncbi:hypothetical protein BDN72DRAFT_837591, partial [Pluteus cervinus]